jgi:hypothetical protein
MATRTIQFRGLAYGETAAAVTATANGNTFFTGTVPTLNEPVPELPNPALASTFVTLFTMDIDTSFSGQIPVMITVTNGTVLVGPEFANYVGEWNPVFTSEQLDILRNPATTQAQKVAIYEPVANPPLSQEDIDILLDPASTQEQRTQICADHGCLTYIGTGPNTYNGVSSLTDPKTNISMNGVPESPDYDELPGAWWWLVDQDSILSYDLNVSPAVV